MKMVGHQAIGMHLPTGPLAGFGQRFNKPVTIRIVRKDSFAAVAAVHEMIDGAGILEAELARHGTKRCQRRLLVSIVMTDPSLTPLLDSAGQSFIGLYNRSTTIGSDMKASCVDSEVLLV
jgi:hypothetical protein